SFRQSTLAQELAAPAERPIAGRKARFCRDRRKARHWHRPSLHCRVRHRSIGAAARTSGGSSPQPQGRRLPLLPGARALRAPRRRGLAAVVLVGDVPYYSRFGFSTEKTAALRMPGPFERDRLLALELIPGSLNGARGLLRAPSERMPQMGLAASAA